MTKDQVIFFGQTYIGEAVRCALATILNGAYVAFDYMYVLIFRTDIEIGEL